MERKKAKESSSLLMDQFLKATSAEMRSTELESMTGLMERDTKVIGSITRCAEKVS